MKWQNFVPEFVVNQWNHWFKKVEGALVYFIPPYVSRKNTFFSPLIALVALIWAIFLLGIAIGSFFMFFASLLVLYFIVTKVFGVRIDLGDVVNI
ncbi:MAG: hypothetical protein HYU99_02155 [Deltaproteobacteria bacterium]|nr:hypothetical protein [Deltaproteobacteria bacterium]